MFCLPLDWSPPFVISQEDRSLAPFSPPLTALRTSVHLLQNTQCSYNPWIQGDGKISRDESFIFFSMFLLFLFPSVSCFRSLLFYPFPALSLFFFSFPIYFSWNFSLLEILSPRGWRAGLRIRIRNVFLGSGIIIPDPVLSFRIRIRPI